MTTATVRIAFCCLVVGCALLGVDAFAAERPNFLLIVADDLNWKDLGCTGSPDVRSPNIDRLAAEGMTLRGMFTPAPTCSPTRHALYTGLYPIRSGAYPNHTTVDEGTQSMFSHFNRLGYRTALQGKTHVAPTSSFPYKHLASNVDDIEVLREFITVKTDQPWLAVVASNDPHSEWTRGRQEMYDPAKITVPPRLHDDPFTREQLAHYFAEITALDGQVGGCLRILEETGQADDTLVMFVSEQGSSFPYGGKWSLYDDGIHVACFVRWPGKIAAGSSSDALMQYVDVPPTFLAAAGVDPTTIDTGCPDADGNRGFDGRSFFDVLTGKSDRLRDFVFAQHTTVGINGHREPYPIRAVRDDRYKLIRNLAPENTYWIGGIHGSDVFAAWEKDAKHDPDLARRLKWLSHRPAEELYDLSRDPAETNNLADDAKLADVKSRLSAELDAWMRQQGDRGMATELEALEHQPRADKKKAKRSAKSKK